MALAGQYVWFTRAFYAFAEARVELRGFVDVVASTVVCEVWNGISPRCQVSFGLIVCTRQCVR